jgi:hypothetical protein
MPMRNRCLLFAAFFLWVGCDQGHDASIRGGITAAYYFRAVDSFADSYDKGLRLQTIRSDDVHWDGTSQTWYYDYVATTETPPITYCLHSTSTAIAFDSTSSLKIGAAVVTHGWFDSDVALMVAEKNGGSDFRAHNPGYTISAALGEPVVPSPTTYWYITYRSEADRSRFLTMTIDANTGAVTGKYSF